MAIFCLATSSKTNASVSADSCAGKIKEPFQEAVPIERAEQNRSQNCDIVSSQQEDILCSGVPFPDLSGGDDDHCRVHSRYNQNIQRRSDAEIDPMRIKQQCIGRKAEHPRNHCHQGDHSRKGQNFLPIL